jgi:SAM-dependent methyltransferase
LDGRPTQYQSFEDANGASRSHDKLRALRLEMLPNRKGGRARPLAGLAVLDLGCNEGFFCGEAVRQGARRVLGIDRDDRVLALARSRFPAAEFRQGTWWDIPDETFDVILLLSAIHYEPDPAALLDRLAGHLAPGGTLVIECGISSRPGKRWQDVTRVDGKVRYPTQPLFVEAIAAPFATRFVGKSIPQKGDPISRRVFHCSRKEGTVLLVTGRGRTGKSALSREFRRLEIPVLTTDTVLGALLRERRFDGSPLAATVRRVAGEPPVHFGRIGNVVAAERPGEFAALLLDEMPRGPDLVCIEGEILRHRSVSDPLVAGLRARRLRPWRIAPGRASLFGSTASRAVAALRALLVRARIAASRAHRSLRTGHRPGSLPAAGNEATRPQDPATLAAPAELRRP